VQDADPRSLVAMAVLLVVAVFVYFNRRKVLDDNLNLFADLLRGQIRFPVLGLPVYATVVGQYKGRAVTCRWSMLTKYENITLYIEAIGVPRSTSWLQKSEGEPTECTYLTGNRIYYCGPSGVSLGTERSRRPYLSGLIRKRLLRTDVAYYLEHLTQAAEVVESGGVQKVLQT
jgi:hypothetical protein